MKQGLHYSDPWPFTALRTGLGAVALFIVLVDPAPASAAHAAAAHHAARPAADHRHDRPAHVGPAERRRRTRVGARLHHAVLGDDPRLGAARGAHRRAPLAGRGLLSGRTGAGARSGAPGRQPGEQAAGPRLGRLLGGQRYRRQADTGSRPDGLHQPHRLADALRQHPHHRHRGVRPLPAHRVDAAASSAPSPTTSSRRRPWPGPCGSTCCRCSPPAWRASARWRRPSSASGRRPWCSASG